jgi:hypothetical protein
MPEYLLSVYQPEGDPPPPDVLGPIMRQLAALNDEMRAAGAWVFDGGLHPPDMATIVRHEGDDVVLTDGPFAEGKEYLGGFTIVRAPDLDAALKWAGEIARITTLPIEVRPFQERDRD